jgi:hypothetical protein
MADETYTAAYYREQAEEARRSATKTTTQENRDGYLKLAADWDRLADDIDKVKARADDDVAMLIRSMPKA